MVVQSNVVELYPTKSPEEKERELIERFARAQLIECPDEYLKEITLWKDALIRHCATFSERYHL